MLSKERRISRTLLKGLEGKKKYSNTEYFSLMSWPSSQRARFAVSVSKKVSKSAVVRNRIRRRTYSALRGMLDKVPPGIHLISAKPNSQTLKGEKLENELRKLLVVSS